MQHTEFNQELAYIENSLVRLFTEKALDLLPEYFYRIPSSSTGRYHPSYALGEGGLVRHTKAAARFAYHMFQLDQTKDDFMPIERDAMLAAILLHDGHKQGDGSSGFTTHEHPQTCANWVLKNPALDGIIPEDIRHLIAVCISSHMGQWNTSKQSKVTLPKPETSFQKFVHLCDYLASRKDIELHFEGVEAPQLRPNETMETYIMPFGKHKGKLLKEVAESNLDYLEWMQKNIDMQEPMRCFIEQAITSKKVGG